MDLDRERTFLVTGGSGSGKSDFAESLASPRGAPVIYLATGKAEGPEMAARIRKHQESRPPDWPTVEAQRGLAAALESADAAAPTVLLEDLASLATACLPWIEERDGEQAQPDRAEQAATQALDAEIDGVLAWCAARGKRLVIVSQEVGLGMLPTSPVGRLFKDVLGAANQRLATRVDRAFLVVAGLPIDLTERSAPILRALAAQRATPRAG
jgi:adenosylcobinamide kinase/adenosylcobinamide-phosphate guanylyltransferase